MRRIDLAISAFVFLALFTGGGKRCDASVNPRFIVRDGKTLVCAVRFADTMSGDCGTESYDAVFTAKILVTDKMRVRSRLDFASARGGTAPSDLRLTVEPEEVFKGNPARKMQIVAEQGECFAEIHVGDEWLFFGKAGAKANELEIWYMSSNPSGPVEQRGEYIERLRRLAHGEGLSYVAGEVDLPSVDLSQVNVSNPRSNHHLLIKAEDGKRSYSVTTDAQGRFELGPVAPGFYQIDADTDPQFRSVWSDIADAGVSTANGCSWVRIDLEVNSEISGRVILPEGYQYKKSEMGNYFPLFYVDVRYSRWQTGPRNFHWRRS